MCLKTKEKKLAKIWNIHNVYDFRLADAIAYTVFYIIIPICITTISLIAFPSDTASGAYCYITIMVSALNSIYDNALRWTPLSNPTFKNTKLFYALFANAIIAVYCLFEIIAILSTNSPSLRCDYLLLIYIIPTFIMMKDFWDCIKRRIISINCVAEAIEV